MRMLSSRLFRLVTPLRTLCEIVRRKLSENRGLFLCETARTVFFLINLTNLHTNLPPVIYHRHTGAQHVDFSQKQ